MWALPVQLHLSTVFD